MNNLIVVCSKNKAKNDAVRSVLEDYFESFEIISLDTNSGVSETPIGDDEGIEGCLNRIKDALIQNNSADLYIAMEGILTKSKYGVFLCGWTLVYNRKEDKYCYGCSAKVKVPDEIIEKLDKDVRLSDVVSAFIGDSEYNVSVYGTNGVLTNGVYTRTDEFIDSLECALSTSVKKLKNNDK